MIGRTNVGGGGGIAVSVKNYSSAEALPSEGKENAIGVITSIAISNYVFTGVMPEGKAIGTACIDVSGGSVSMSIDKKGIVTLYPATCNIWDGSAWTLCDAFIYKNGSWEQFASAIPTYFENGNQFESITGGWSAEGYTVGNRTNYGETTIGNTIHVKAKGKLIAAVAGTMNPIDLTNVSTIYFKVTEVSHPSSNSKVGVSTSKDIVAILEIDVPSTGLVSLDVSALPKNEKYYIFAYVNNSTSDTTRTMTIDKIYAE